VRNKEEIAGPEFSNTYTPDCDKIPRISIRNIMMLPGGEQESVWQPISTELAYKNKIQLKAFIYISHLPKMPFSVFIDLLRAQSPEK
jgi:hypothetical protein